jgi:hypothetical protein
LDVGCQEILEAILQIDHLLTTEHSAQVSSEIKRCRHLFPVLGQFNNGTVMRFQGKLWCWIKVSHYLRALLRIYMNGQ